MNVRAWLFLALVETLLTLAALAIGWLLRLSYTQHPVAVVLTVVVSWLAASLLNAGELIKRRRFNNSERDAEIAYGRNLEPNGGRR